MPDALPDDGLVALEEGVSGGLDKSETLVEAGLVEVIEEQPADAARFAAVLEVEVLVAPGLEAWVKVLAEGVAGPPGDPVPVYDVLVEGVIRCQVEAATEPPDRLARLP